MICDICGEKIVGGFYELPDGMTVCEDCLKEWADHYSRLKDVDDE